MLYIVHHYYHNHDKVDCVCKLNMDALKIVLVENIQLLYKLLSQLLFQDVTYEKNNIYVNSQKIINLYNKKTSIEINVKMNQLIYMSEKTFSIIFLEYIRENRKLLENFFDNWNINQIIHTLTEIELITYTICSIAWIIIYFVITEDYRDFEGYTLEKIEKII